MAGHSHAHNVMFKKGANDAKKAKIFTKIAREIAMAVKNGIKDPELNPKLKMMIVKARSCNMPKDKIEQAIAKANKDTEDYEDVRYNVMFENGISLIIEGATDNKNRTASDIRGTISKFGAQLVSTGSVEYMYSHIGRIIYQKDICDEEKIFEVAVNAGADDVIIDEECYIIETKIENMIDIAKNLTDEFKKDPQEVGFIWKANDYIDISKNNELKEKYNKLIDAIEDIDDVNDVYSNADFE